MILPYASSQEAVSDTLRVWVEKVDQWKGWSIRHLVSRLACWIFGSFFAGMDLFYHSTGFWMKASILTCRKVFVLWPKSWGRNLSTVELRAHLYFIGCYSCAVISAPFIGWYDPKLLMRLYDHFDLVP